MKIFREHISLRFRKELSIPFDEFKCAWGEFSFALPALPDAISNSFHRIPRARRAIVPGSGLPLCLIHCLPYFFPVSDYHINYLIIADQFNFRCTNWSYMCKERSSLTSQKTLSFADSKPIIISCFFNWFAIESHGKAFKCLKFCDKWAKIVTLCRLKTTVSSIFVISETSLCLSRNWMCKNLWFLTSQKHLRMFLQSCRFYRGFCR